MKFNESTTRKINRKYEKTTKVVKNLITHYLKMTVSQNND